MFVYESSIQIIVLLSKGRTNVPKQTSRFKYLSLLKCQKCKLYKGNNKITELRTILQRESQNS